MSKFKKNLFLIIKNILNPITKNLVYTYKFGNTPIKLKGGLGLARFKMAPSKEEQFISSLDFDGKTAYDIGGHIGVLAVFMGKSVGSSGRVISFEPNPESYDKIIKNIELNKITNVQLNQIGISDKKKTETLAIRKNLSATGSMEKDIQSTILKEKGVKILEVETDTLDNLISEKNLPIPDFIKIDIEGMEYNALLGMSKTIKSAKPDLYIEIHGADQEKKLQNIKQVVDYLEQHNYDILHIESDKKITLDNSYIAKEGHLFCKKN